MEVCPDCSKQKIIRNDIFPCPPARGVVGACRRPTEVIDTVVDKLCDKCKEKRKKKKNKK
jgi:hypothetical protein